MGVKPLGVCRSLWDLSWSESVQPLRRLPARPICGPVRNRKHHLLTAAGVRVFPEGALGRRATGRGSAPDEHFASTLLFAGIPTSSLVVFSGSALPLYPSGCPQQHPQPFWLTRFRKAPLVRQLTALGWRLRLSAALPALPPPYFSSCPGIVSPFWCTLPRPLFILLPLRSFLVWAGVSDSPSHYYQQQPCRFLISRCVFTKTHV